MKETLLLCLLIALTSCGNISEKSDVVSEGKAIQEIYDMEQAFNDLLAKEGRAVAFAHFAAEDGAISRSGEMIEGKAAIKAFYDKSTTTNVSLTWKPDRVQMSEDYTMASTWGKFNFSGTRQNGEPFESTGYFHTVWQKQKDGSWRYIYD